jgi:hypothetical protein
MDNFPLFDGEATDSTALAAVFDRGSSNFMLAISNVGHRSTLGTKLSAKLVYRAPSKDGL